MRPPHASPRRAAGLGTTPTPPLGSLACQHVPATTHGLPLPTGPPCRARLDLVILVFSPAKVHTSSTENTHSDHQGVPQTLTAGFLPRRGYCVEGSKNRCSLRTCRVRAMSRNRKMTRIGTSFVYTCEGSRYFRVPSPISATESG